LERYQLSLVSFLYYQKGMSQHEIADKFGLSNMTVSRLLQRAKEHEIVKIHVSFPFEIDDSISNSLETQYGIKKAIVIKSEGLSDEEKSELIGRIWAFNMNLSYRNDYVLGLGLGITIGHMVKYLLPMKTKNVHVVQLMGGLTDVTYKSPFTIVQETCRKLHAQGTYVTSSVVVENKKVRDSVLYDTPTGKQIRDLWNKCDEAIFGIGTIDKGYILSPELVHGHDIEELRRDGVIGDIMGHCINAKGEFVSTHLEERLVHVPLEIFKKLPERIAIAGGKKKADTIRAALLSGIITTFVTDKETAKNLLNQ